MLEEVMGRIVEDQLLSPHEKQKLLAKTQLAAQALKQAGRLSDKQQRMVRRLVILITTAMDALDIVTANAALSEIVRVANGAEWRQYKGYSTQSVIQHTVWELEAPNKKLAEAFLYYEFDGADEELARRLGEELYAEDADVDLEVEGVE